MLVSFLIDTSVFGLILICLLVIDCLCSCDGWWVYLQRVIGVLGEGGGCDGIVWWVWWQWVVGVVAVGGGCGSSEWWVWWQRVVGVVAVGGG